MATRTLMGEPAGLGTLPMGCLDHNGYSMSNTEDFYGKFIVELVPNNANDAKWKVKDLKPVKHMHPRIDTRLFNSDVRWAINAPDRMNVMYSLDPLGKGKVSCLKEVMVPSDDAAFAEARACAYEDQVRPRLIHFPFPSSPERYLWIDLSWPIRNILLPISQVSYPGEKPNCTYVQINFRQLSGKLPIRGWAEDGNQGFCDWVGDGKRGLVWDESAAAMRIDLDLLYKVLTLPRHMRRDDFNLFLPLQLHRWDVGVPYNPRLPLNSNGEFVGETGRYVSNYVLTGGKSSRLSTEGVAFDKFLSDVHGVQVQYRTPPQSVMVNILNIIVSTGLGFIPVIGPLLAVSNNLAFRVLQDPDSMDVKNQLTAEFGVELAAAIIESALGYRSLMKKQSTGHVMRPGTRSLHETMPKLLYSGDWPEGYKLNPDIMEPTEQEKEMTQKYGPKTVDVSVAPASTS